MLKTVKYSRFIIEFILCTCLFAASCNRKGTAVSEETDMTDPTQTYSIVRPDNGSGIEVISEDGSDPLKVREFIQSYPIPEKSFTARRAKFFHLLDLLKKETGSDSVRYDQVDSLNYMAIHYLLEILKDPKSITSGVRHPLLHCCTSADKRLRVYSWNEHIAPEQQSRINVFQYKLRNGILYTVFPGSGQTHGETDYRTGQIEKIYPMYRQGDSVELYLLHYSGLHGSGHMYKGFGCVKMLPDSLDFSYPAFDGKYPYVTLHYSGTENADAYFDGHKRSLRLWVAGSTDGSRDSIGKRYTFDGIRFIPTGY